jgi:hypothetical protein
MIEKEIIPDPDLLYYRIHWTWFVGGQLNPHGFKDFDGGMSTNWSRYSNPVDTQKEGKVPNDNGVVQLIAGAVRQIDALIVDHDPKPYNQAHTNIIGEKDEQVQVLLSRIVTWCISVPEREAS